MKEEIVLVDRRGQPIGQTEKLAGHHAHTELHLAFSCYVFNDAGQFLVTKRADSKKVWPSVWTNSCCGHPAPGEAMESAIARRLQFELGMTVTDLTVLVPDYVYKTPPFKGIIEHEYCPVYAARATSVPQPNPAEVSEFKWMSWQQYINESQADEADAWSWWCKDQLRLLADNQTILSLAS